MDVNGYAIVQVGLDEHIEMMLDNDNDIVLDVAGDAEEATTICLTEALALELIAELSSLVAQARVNKLVAEIQAAA